MADYISLSLTPTSDAGLSLQAYNNGQEDSSCYMKVVNAGGFSLQPLEKLSVLIIPDTDPITPIEASGYLSDTNQRSDTARGMYIYRTQNTESTPKTLTEVCTFTLTSVLFENIKFDVYWLQEQEGTVIFSSNTGGVYSFPHNLQPGKVKVQAELINDNTKVRYTLKFPEVNNSGSPDYSTQKPYLLNLSYMYGTGIVSGYFGGNVYEFPDVLTYSGFSAGEPTAGIVFELPFYDQRPLWQEVPASYKFRLNYNCADPILTGSYPLLIPINHQQWADNQIIDLDTQISTNIDPAKLRKVNEVYIERGVIDRKRFSIGIKDIVVKNNVYKRKGTYISKPYTTDFPLYTFSMKVDEFIPNYPETNPYDLVQYFIEFNSRPWVRISPINRNNEIGSDGELVPRMFIFDSGLGDVSTSVSFLNYQAPVNIFRVKIVFDLSSVNETMFIPPEIRDYDCIVFDKNQLLEI
jgi:hypothetical protein